MKDKLQKFLQSHRFHSFQNRLIFHFLTGILFSGTVFCLFEYLPFFGAVLLSAPLCFLFFILIGMRTGNGMTAFGLTLGILIFTGMLKSEKITERDLKNLKAGTLGTLQNPYSPGQEKWDYLVFPKAEIDLKKCTEEKHTSSGGSVKRPYNTVSVYTLCPIAGTSEFAAVCIGFEGVLEERFPCSEFWKNPVEAGRLAEKDIRFQRMLNEIQTKHSVMFSENVQILYPLDPEEFRKKERTSGYKSLLLILFFWRSSLLDSKAKLKFQHFLSLKESIIC
ncbi:MAG TPA: hypothetical protein PK683_21350 [Leptospiraceae bacterium]|nr:hypothetical protein [Leptospiraceae bacterium]